MRSQCHPLLAFVTALGLFWLCGVSYFLLSRSDPLSHAQDHGDGNAHTDEHNHFDTLYRPQHKNDNAAWEQLLNSLANQPEPAPETWVPPKEEPPLALPAWIRERNEPAKEKPVVNAEEKPVVNTEEPAHVIPAWVNADKATPPITVADDKNTVAATAKSKAEAYDYLAWKLNPRLRRRDPFYPRTLYDAKPETRSLIEEALGKETAVPTSSAVFPSTLSPVTQRLPLTTSHETRSIALVVLTHDRTDYLVPTLQALAAQSEKTEFTFYISCDSPKDWPKIESTLSKIDNLPTYQVWVHEASARIENKEAERVARHRQLEGLPTRDPFTGNSYYKIARHYFLALDNVFAASKHTHAVLLEEDLMPAPDMLRYFLETSVLLEHDTSLWCVSAWNDNGHADHVSDEQRLFRSEYFPGLGWMLKRELWQHELRAKWPSTATTGWDHWIRLNSIRKDRECVVPEVSRTRHVSEEGTNVHKATAKKFKAMGFASGSLLQPSDTGTSLVFGDLSYLLQSNYEDLMQKLVMNAEALTVREAASMVSKPASETDIVRIVYTADGQWKPHAAIFGLWVAGAGYRGVHKGVIPVRSNGHALLLVSQAHCSYLEQRTLPPQMIAADDSVVLQAAPRGVSCTTACKDSGRVCRADQFHFHNHCTALQSVFACEGGCGFQVGKEIPCYVVEHETAFQQCLVTDGLAADCDASHRTTQRLCPCGSKR